MEDLFTQPLQDRMLIYNSTNEHNKGCAYIKQLLEELQQDVEQLEVVDVVLVGVVVMLLVAMPVAVAEQCLLLQLVKEPHHLLLHHHQQNLMEQQQ